MSKLISLAGWLLLICLCQSCAGSSSGGAGATQYLADLGVATNNDFKEEAQRIVVSKHNYIVQRFEESSGRVYFETDWKDRLPFEDEKQAGVIQARSRIIMEGRSRVRAGSPWQTATLKVNFKGENMLLYQGGDGWAIGSPMTPRCREYFKSLANEIRTEFRTKVREY